VTGEKGVKSSGWRALKSVVQWWDTTMEIQIQVIDARCVYYFISQEKKPAAKTMKEKKRK
jgi:hypothetical protein